MLERIEKLERSIAEITREVYAVKQEAEQDMSMTIEKIKNKFIAQEFENSKLLDRIERLELERQAEQVAEQEQHKAPELVYELDISGQFAERECWDDYEIVGLINDSCIRIGAERYDLLELGSICNDSSVKWIGLGYWNDGLQG